jgi:hypothetical protein
MVVTLSVLVWKLISLAQERIKIFSKTAVLKQLNYVNKHPHSKLIILTLRYASEIGDFTTRPETTRKQSLTMEVTTQKLTHSQFSCFVWNSYENVFRL